MSDIVVIQKSNPTTAVVSQGAQGPAGPQGLPGDVGGSLPWSNITSKPDATATTDGVMTAEYAAKLDGIESGANNYTHPTGDGNLHVPATGTGNSGKVLTAGATAGALTWETPTGGGGSGTVTEVTGTAPISVATGTTTPAISMAAATASADGYMTKEFASKLDGVAAGATANLGTVTAVTGAGAISSTGGTTPEISIAAATTLVPGTMSAADKTKLDGVAASANNYTHPNHTGDVTSVADGATTIAAKAVTLAKMADVASGSVFYRKTTEAGAPEVQTLATLKTDLGLTGTNSGDQTSVSGNAGTATKLATARAINGVDFDGSAAITVYDATRKPFHGVVSRTDNTIAFDTGTLKVTMTKTGTSFDIWVLGTKYTKTTVQEVEITNTVGLWYIYYDGTGTLQATQNAGLWDLRAIVPVAQVFWNGIAGALTDERHNATRDLDWHAWAHLTVGARYRSGLAFTNTSTAPSTFSVATGTINDEDITFEILSAQTTCRTWYQNGASSYTFASTASAYPFVWNGATSRARYPNSASSYALTDFASNRYFNVWVYAATDTGVPVYAFTQTFSGASGGYTSTSQARAITPPTLSDLGLSPELKLLYRVIYSGDGNWIEQTDYRNSSSLPAGGTSTPTAASVSFTPSGSVAATTVQGAIEELDTEKISTAAIGVSVQAHAAAASQVEMEAGTEATLRSMSPLRVAQAIAALGGSGGGLTQTAVKTSAYTAAAGELVRLDSAAGAFTVTLPEAPADKDVIGFLDVTSSCGTNAVLIAAAGSKTVEGDATGLSIDVAGAYVELTYYSAGGNWKAMETPAIVNGLTADGSVPMTGDLQMGSNGVVFEGATANDYEVTLNATDPTADRAINLPDASGTLATTAQLLGGFKNKIIGGDFTTNPWQRGTSFTAPGGVAYVADRFRVVHSSDTVVNVLKTVDAPTVAEAGMFTQHCLHCDVTTADASIAAGQYYLVDQLVEGLNAASFGFGQAGTRYVTLSFWHKHTKTGVYCVAILNSAINRSYVAEYTQDTANTWEKATITIPVDTTGTWLYDTGVGLIVRFTVASGSTFQTTVNTWATGLYFATANQVNGLDDAANDFKLALIQLEAGSVATPFEARLGGIELGLCQRYLPSVSGGSTAMGMCYLSNAGQVTIPFPVKARVAPSGLSALTPSNFLVATASFDLPACSSVTYASAGLDTARIAFGVSGTPLVAGAATMFFFSQEKILFTGCEL